MLYIKERKVFFKKEYVFEKEENKPDLRSNNGYRESAHNWIKKFLAGKNKRNT